MPINPLPSYTRAKKLKSGRKAYFWELPSWARPPAERNGRTCPIQSTALGDDLAEAVGKANALNSAFSEWRLGVTVPIERGSVRALFAWYREQPRFLKAKFKTRRDYRHHMDKLEAFKLKSGALLGDLQAKTLTAAHVDRLYGQLQKDGARTATYSMQTCRRVWNEAKRHGLLPKDWVNPFAAMGLKSTSAKGNRATSRAEYDAFRAKAREMGFQSAATAAAIMFELCRRKTDALGLDFGDDDAPTIAREDYTPGVEIRLRQGKTGDAQVIPLSAPAEVGAERVSLYPELEAELARTKVKMGHLIIFETTGKRYTEDQADDVFRKIHAAAKLPAGMTWTGFRHGGITELGDAGVTDVRPISGHRTLQQTTVYNKANESKARTAGRARRAHVGMASE